MTSIVDTRHSRSTYTNVSQYERFWVDPTQTSVMWIGLLFAILCLGTRNPEPSGESVSAAGERSVLADDYTSHTLRDKVVQCLLLGEYMKCGPYTIETLVMYLAVISNQSEDPQLEVWVLLGIIVRLALRMGYHRDGCHSPQISAFQSEIRRRFWAVIFQLDVTTSAQFGLPRMIRPDHTDTAEPRNLIDEDLDENLITLPPSRPDTEPTQVLFVAMKNRIVAVFGLVMDLEACTRPPSYSEVMSLDTKARDTYTALPPALQLRSMSQSILDIPKLIMGRIFVALLHYKTFCILHRKYLVLARDDSRYSYSRSSCIEGALKILEIYSMLDAETQPGGRLPEYKWRGWSIVRQEFLLATTILCLEIDHETRAPTTSLPDQYPLDEETKQRVLKALKDSYPLWVQSSESSRESRRVVQALRIVLGKAQNMQTQPMDFTNTNVDPTAGAEANTSYETLNFSNESWSGQAAAPDYLTHMQMDSFDMVSGFMTKPRWYSSADTVQNNWDPTYQAQSIDEYLDMSDWSGMFQFPVS